MHSYFEEGESSISSHRENTKSQMRYTFLNRRPQLYNSVLRMINYNEYISDMKFVTSIKKLCQKIVNIIFQNPDKALTELCKIIM